MKGKEELLNTRFALSEFKLEEGENLLKEMQELRDELSNYEDEVQRLIEAAGEIVPLRARSERLRQPIDAVAICLYQSHDVSTHSTWVALFTFLLYLNRYNMAVYELGGVRKYCSDCLYSYAGLLIVLVCK